MVKFKKQQAEDTINIVKQDIQVYEKKQKKESKTLPLFIKRENIGINQYFFEFTFSRRFF